MNINFHAIVIISTIIGYLFIRNHNVRDKTEKSNLIYVLLIPALLYTGQYLYGGGDTSDGSFIKDITVKNDMVSSNDVLSGLYPASTIDT